MSSSYNSANIFPAAPLPTFIQLPDDGDPFVAFSANIFERGLNDRNSYVLGSLVKETSNDSTVGASSYNGTVINVFPFKAQLALSGVYYITPNDMPTTIDSSNLSPAGSFANNTWYYVYANVSLFFGVPIFSIIISTTEPLPYTLYKDNGGTQDLSNKFLFSFKTDGAASIIPFQKKSNYTQYITPRNIITNGNDNPGPISLTALIPPHTTLGQIKVKYTPADPSIPSEMAILQSTFTDLVFPAMGGRNAEQFVTLSLIHSAGVQNLQYLVTVPMLGTPGTTTIDLLGYYE